MRVYGALLICGIALAAEVAEPLKVWGNKLLATIDPISGKTVLEDGIKQEEVTLALLAHIRQVTPPTAAKDSSANQAKSKTTKK